MSSHLVKVFDGLTDALPSSDSDLKRDKANIDGDIPFVAVVGVCIFLKTLC
jgi:hypothetical protein